MRDLPVCVPLLCRVGRFVVLVSGYLQKVLIMTVLLRIISIVAALIGIAIVSTTPFSTLFPTIPSVTAFFCSATIGLCSMVLERKALKRLDKEA